VDHDGNELSITSKDQDCSVFPSVATEFNIPLRMAGSERDIDGTQETPVLGQLEFPSRESPWTPVSLSTMAATL